MIAADRRILCESCQRRNNAVTMARLKGSVLVLWGRHHGQQHEQAIELSELLPEPDSEEYAAIVADLLRRIPG